MNQYDSYKPSGIDWIGDIPSHWEVKRLKRFAKICNGQDQKDVADEKGIYPIVGSGGEFGKSNKFLHQGPSVLLGRKGTVDKPQYIERPFWSVDTAYYTDIFSETDPRFFFYSCLTIRFDLYKYGSAVPSMTQEVLNQVPLACPPPSEQAAIASYLDKKTVQLDTLMDRKRRLIDLLREEKTALINEAVTKGIHPNVTMNDSGIEWLGEVPAHWEVTKAKYVSSIFIPQRNKPELNSSEGIPWVTMDDVKDTYVNKSINGYFVSVLEAEKAGSKTLPAGSVIASCVGNFGVSSINTKQVIINQQLQAFIPTRIYPELLKMFIVVSKSYFEIEATATTIPFVNREKFENLPICLPPKHEQILIVEYINAETAKIDHTISRIEREIELMQECRTALISEVVTGKVCIEQFA